MPGNPNRRIRVIFFLFLLVFGAVAARAAFLQTVKADQLSEMAQQQHVQEFDLPARRGTIFDRGGNELAVGEERRTIYATPYLVEDPLQTAEVLAPLLSADTNEILQKLLDRDSGFVYLARKVDPEIAGQIEAMDITGLGFLSEEKRLYPQKQVAAQVLGFAGTENHGLAGVELQQDSVLAGTGGRQRVITDAGGKEIKMLSLEEGTRGTDIWLTIDQAIQFETEKILAETVEEWSAKGAAAVVMDPRTGEILAMANVPTADANNFDGLPEELKRNRAVTDNYEPGSVFKAIIASVVLEEQAVAPGETIYLPPEMELGGHTIGDAMDRGEVSWDVGQILVNSSNIGAVTMGMRVGGEKLNEWIGRFGFGTPTGVDFPGEAEGIVLPLEKWSDSTIGNVPIGQGISVTAIQMVAAYSAIANGGKLASPHLVCRIGDEPVMTESERILSEESAGQMTQYLTRVVEEEGAPLARVDGYRVAGKTGTAQKPLPDGSGYSNDDYIGSFIGFAPAADPQLVILVMVDEPRPFGGGATVAAPAFKKIAQFSLQKMSIAP
ncbi:MAG: penicillin-binding protein 2 [Thermoleophilia bacterium]|nr:penicillin-binding protein 2 [Thermoleophilia bacterium]